MFDRIKKVARKTGTYIKEHPFQVGILVGGAVANVTFAVISNNIAKDRELLWDTAELEALDEYGVNGVAFRQRDGDFILMRETTSYESIE